MTLEDRILALAQAIGIDIKALQLSGALPNFVTIDFGAKPINEKSFNIINPLCTVNSNIEASQVFKSQTEANFGVTLELFTECADGNFNIIAVSSEPFSRGIFNIKYTIYDTI